MTHAPCIVFVGPSLPAAEVQHLLPGADVRPPAAQGDLYRAARQQPRAIGLIDGEFLAVPAVWHKEILWALHRGVHVFGAASMGALRAAELHPFGMVGVGHIFEAYRDGVLEGDDEVTLLHGPAELGWLPLSVPLVNVRAALEQAQAAAVLEGHEAAGLLELARGLFFAERSWQRILDAAPAQGLAPGRVTALQTWLQAHRVDRKRDDARMLLQVMAQRCTPDLPPLQPNFAFEDTLHWCALQAQIDMEAAALSPADRLRLGQLAGSPPLAAELQLLSLGWAMAQAQTSAPEWPDAHSLLAESRAFCEHHGLHDEAAVQRWLESHGMTADDLQRILSLHAVARELGQAPPAALERAWLDHLRWSGADRRPQDAGPGA